MTKYLHYAPSVSGGIFLYAWAFSQGVLVAANKGKSFRSADALRRWALSHGYTTLVKHTCATYTDLK